MELFYGVDKLNVHLSTLAVNLMYHVFSSVTVTAELRNVTLHPTHNSSNTCVFYRLVLICSNVLESLVENQGMHCGSLDTKVHTAHEMCCYFIIHRRSSCVS